MYLAYGQAALDAFVQLEMAGTRPTLYPALALSINELWLRFVEACVQTRYPHHFNLSFTRLEAIYLGHDKF
jgi:hypothetical protein